MKKDYNKIIPVRLREEHVALLKEATEKDEDCNGKVSTFMRNAAIDKAKRVIKK